MRNLDTKKIASLIIECEESIKDLDIKNKNFYFVLVQNDDTVAYQSPWPAVSVSDAVYKTARTLAVLDDESPLIKHIDDLSLTLWFIGDYSNGDIITVNKTIAQLSELIKE